MKTHQLSKHPLYRLWNSVKGRCRFKSSTSYKYYGAKGIDICNEWADSFMNFYNWAVYNGWQLGLSIERRENDKGYCPDNCLFIPIEKQQSNRSHLKQYELNGQSKLLTEWCIEYKMNPARVFRRLMIGWPFERAILTPIKTQKNPYNTQK